MRGKTGEKHAARSDKGTSIAYCDAELEAILKWLKDGLSASKIASLASRELGRPVSRNAIIALVHRNGKLKAVGFARKGPSRQGGKRAGVAVGKPAGRTKPMPALAPLKRQIEGPVAAPALRVARGRVFAEEPGEYDLKSRRVGLMELRAGDCKFPVNDAAAREPHLFCGLAAEPGSSYCRHHRLRCAGAGTAGERFAGGYMSGQSLRDCRGRAA
jgi:hypothetical protein